MTWDSVEQLVVYCYETFLGRTPSLEEVAIWATFCRKAGSLMPLVNFFGAPEFFKKQPRLFDSLLRGASPPEPPLPAPQPPPAPPGTPVFTRAYRGGKTGNANRLWEWTPGPGTAPTSYRLRLVSATGTVIERKEVPASVTSYQHREDYERYRFPTADKRPLPQGKYALIVNAVNAAGDSPHALDTFTVSYFLDPTITDMGRQDMGLGTCYAHFPPGEEIRDGVALRYSLQVVANEGAEAGGKILFGACRLADVTGEVRPHALQQNFYTSRAEYTDPLCDQNFPPYDGKRQEACLVLALSDYEGTGKIGATTYSPATLPRCFSLVDGRPELPNITMRLQENMNGKVAHILVERGEIVTDRNGWRCQLGRMLIGDDPYREWRTTITVDGHNHVAGMVVPANVAEYLSWWGMFGWAWEFPLLPGYFTVHIWDVQVKRESGVWVPVHTWQVEKHVGYGTDFGFRAAPRWDGFMALEASNVAPVQYEPAGSVFTT